MVNWVKQLQYTKNYTKNALMRTLRGYDFYQFGPSNLRELEKNTDFAIFFCDKMKQEILKSTVWSIDGTFSVCPKPWVQLYTISILKNQHVIPIIFILLKTKSEVEYRKMIFVIRRLIPGLTPKIIICDFEKAAINAFGSLFPSARLSGCLFHLGQNVQKKINSLGLSVIHSQSESVQNFVKAMKCFLYFI